MIKPVPASQICVGDIVYYDNDYDNDPQCGFVLFVVETTHNNRFFTGIVIDQEKRANFEIDDVLYNQWVKCYTKECPQEPYRSPWRKALDFLLKVAMFKVW